MFSILKLEICNSIRDKSFKYLMLLPIIGVSIILSIYVGNGYNFFESYIRSTGPLLGFSISFVILISVMIGRKDIEIIQIININIFKKFLCKIAIIISIILYCISIIVISYYIVGLSLSVDIVIMNNYIGMIIFYSFLYSVVFMCIGLMLGVFLGHIFKGIFAYILSVIFVFMFSGYGTNSMVGTVLNNINEMSSFNIMKFDLYTVSLAKVWTAIALIAVAIFITVVLLRKRDAKWKISFVLLIIMVSLLYPFMLKLTESRPTAIKEYKVAREWVIEESDKTYDNVSRISKETPIVLEATGEEKFQINKYNMNITFGNELSNKCSMDIIILEDDIKNIDLMFYGKSEVQNLTINGIVVDYNQDASRLYIDTSKLKLKNLDEIKLDIEYSSYIYTYMEVFEYHYINKYGAYLDYKVAWYPMIYDDLIKEYEIIITTENSVLFSNLDVENISNGYKLSGNAPDVIILAGDDKLVSTEYDGVTFYSSDLQMCIDDNFEGMTSFWDNCKNGNPEYINYEYVMNDIKDLKDVKKVFWDKRPYVIRQIGNTIVW